MSTEMKTFSFLGCCASTETTRAQRQNSVIAFFISPFPRERRARSWNLAADFKNARLFGYRQQDFIFASGLAQNINLGGVPPGSEIDSGQVEIESVVRV